MKIRAFDPFSIPFNNSSKNCKWREDTWLYTCNSTTKYVLSTFLKGREREATYGVGAVYNTEWKGSFRTICAEGNREFYAGRDLYISFKRRLQRPWILHLGKQTIYPFYGPIVPLLVLFFKSISERIHDRTCGLSVDKPLLHFIESRFISFHQKFARKEKKKNIIAGTDKSSFLSTRSNVSYPLLDPLLYARRKNGSNRISRLSNNTPEAVASASTTIAFNPSV